MNKLNFSWVIENKLAGHEGPSSEQDLIWLRQQGVLSLVRLIEKDKAEVTTDQIIKQGLWDCHEPIPDFGAPNQDQINKITQFIATSIAGGRPVGVSCKYGQGRTGTILACYMVKQGFDAIAAIDEVRNMRPGSIETSKQEDAIGSFALKVRNS